MPRKPSRPPVICEFFTWRLFKRDGVIYADGRTGKHNLGKHSLGTRDLDKAMANLRVLDRKKAVALGLVAPSSTISSTDLPLATGWERFMAKCQASPVLGGVAPRTLAKYRAGRDKHLLFCAKQSISSWQEINRASTERYGNWLHGRVLADRTIYFELTLIKSVMAWLIDQGSLPETCRFKLPLSKPVGTDTYCYGQDEVAAIIAFVGLSRS